MQSTELRSHLEMAERALELMETHNIPQWRAILLTLEEEKGKGLDPASCPFLEKTKLPQLLKKAKRGAEVRKPLRPTAGAYAHRRRMNARGQNE